MTQFSKEFRSLLNEALLTNEMLGLGVTQIRKANYANKGIYFQAFTGMSIGLERIGKICVMLNYFIDNNGTFPSDAYMRHNIGHNLERLYEISREIVLSKSISFNYSSNLGEPIYLRILEVLSEFARGDRYSNIDLLAGSNRSVDPVNKWRTQVDEYIYENFVSERSKEIITLNAKTVEELLGGYARVFHVMEDGSTVDNIFVASYQTGFSEKIAPLRQFYLLIMIRYWCEMLIQLGYKASDVSNQDVPYFSEIFGHFINENRILKSRKTWNGL